MKTASLTLAVCAGLMMGAPALAQQNFGNVISGVAQNLITQEMERNAFQQAQRVNTLAGWREFLQNFPNGAYRASAEQAVTQLGGTVRVVDPTPAAPATPAPAASSAASAEASIGLSREQRRQIQTQLSRLGYNTGTPDGLWGRNTRDAISRWQTANSAEATGYVTAAQVRLIGEQAGVPGGAATPPVSAGDDQVEERLLALSSAERREIQSRLTALGYNTYGADGVFGQNTRRAIAAWQQSEGERASGYITADQLRDLRQQSSSASR